MTGSLPSDTVLPLKALHVDNGRTLKRLRCVVIPQNARIDIRINARAIFLRGWNNLEATIDNPAIVVEKDDSGLVFKCPGVDNQDELKPFSAVLTPKNSYSYGFWQLRMVFDYPQSIFAFKFQGGNLPRDAIVTIDEVREVKAYAVTGDSTCQFEAKLELLPDIRGGTDGSGRDYRYELNIPINQYTSSGTLSYEDFREPLFREMRLAGNAETVSLRIRTAVGAAKAHIHVSYQTENLKCFSGVDVIKCELRKPHVLQFIPLIDDGTLVDPFEVGSVTFVLLSKICPNRKQPWIVFDRDDDKHRLRPLVIPPSAPRSCSIEGNDVVADQESEGLTDLTLIFLIFPSTYEPPCV